MVRHKLERHQTVKPKSFPVLIKADDGILPVVSLPSLTSTECNHPDRIPLMLEVPRDNKLASA